MSQDGYTRRDGRYVAFESVTLIPAGLQFASGAGPVVEMGNLCTLRADLAVRRVPGAGATLDVVLEGSFDGVAGWRLVGAFAQATAPGRERKCFAALDRFVRAVVTVGSMPAPSARVGAVVAAGTSPPAVTLTGTPATPEGCQVRLEVTTAGGRGAMRFRFSLDGGRTVVADVPGAAAVALGASGLTANFPVGAYAMDQTFDANVAPAFAFEISLDGEAV